jgi:hypothetical protein
VGCKWKSLPVEINSGFEVSVFVSAAGKVFPGTPIKFACAQIRAEKKNAVFPLSLSRSGPGADPRKSRACGRSRATGREINGSLI